MATNISLIAMSPTLTKKFVAKEGQDGFQKIISQKVIAQKANGKSEEEALKLVRKELTEIFEDYINESRRIDFDKLKKELAPHSEVQVKRKTLPINVVPVYVNNTIKRPKDEYGKLYSNSYGFLGKYIAIHRGEGGAFIKTPSERKVKIRPQIEYGKGTFFLGEQGMGKTVGINWYLTLGAMGGISQVYFDPQGEHYFEKYRDNYQEFLYDKGWDFEYPGEDHPDQDIREAVVRVDARDIRFDMADVNPLQLIYLSDKLFYDLGKKEMQVLQTMYSKISTRYMIKYKEDVEPPNTIITKAITSVNKNTNMRIYGLGQKYLPYAESLKNRLEFMQLRVRMVEGNKKRLDIGKLCTPHYFQKEEKGIKKTIKWGKIVIIDFSSLGDLQSIVVQSKLQLIGYTIMNKIFKERQKARLKGLELQKLKHKVNPIYEFIAFPRVMITIDEAPLFTSKYEDALAQAYLTNMRIGDKVSVGVAGVFRMLSDIAPNILNEARRFIVFRTSITDTGNKRFLGKFTNEGYNEDIKNFIGGLPKGEACLFGFDSAFVEGGPFTRPIVVKFPPSPFEDFRGRKDHTVEESSYYNW